MKVFPQGKLRLDEKDLKADLGCLGKLYIFVGSSTDMWADEVPSEWIRKVLYQCNMYPENTYLFQTKNPKRFDEFVKFLPDKTILGITLESNRNYNLSSMTPKPSQRFIDFVQPYDKMVSIEPILDFDLKTFVCLINLIQPEFVSIGADSKGHKLPEPSKEKVEALITELKKFTEVKIKDNLKRLMK
jgi:protein gp37